MLSFGQSIILCTNIKTHKKRSVKCTKHLQIEKQEEIKYKEQNDPDYFREDFYGLKKLYEKSDKIQKQEN